jgi:hypothetical protein
MWKITTSAAAIALSLCLATSAEAAHAGGFGGGGGGGGAHFGGGGGGGAHFGGGGGGGAHFGGGGGMHMGGGAPHFGGGGARMGGGAPHMGAVHMGGARLMTHGAPHMSGGRFNAGRFNSHTASQIGHPGRSAFHAAIHGQGAHGTLNHGALNHVGNPASVRSGLAGTHFAHANAAFAGRRSFAANRQFAAGGAFHPFWNHGWHWHNHLGWIGPLFWPFAYGDFFYYALWPDDYYYYDPVWVYGYPDIYQGIFSPYDYSEYVQGPSAPARMKALTESMTQSCDDEATEVTGWPIDQIKEAVQPNQQQAALLDDLGNAVVKASDMIRSHCPTSVSFTPTGRLDTMQQRLQGLVQAVNIVSEPLGKFYDSLNDEQKARFNSIKPATDTDKRVAPNAATPKSDCDASAMAWPTDQVERVVQPNDAQRAKLDALQAAAARGADIIKAACPSESPSTPPARLAAVGKHLEAMLQAVDMIRPPLHDFYNALSDSQKARFNTMGRQLFAQKT